MVKLELWQLVAYLVQINKLKRSPMFVVGAPTNLLSIPTVTPILEEHNYAEWTRHQNCCFLQSPSANYTASKITSKLF